MSMPSNGADWRLNKAPTEIKINPPTNHKNTTQQPRFALEVHAAELSAKKSLGTVVVPSAWQKQVRSPAQRAKSYLHSFLHR